MKVTGDVLMLASAPPTLAARSGYTRVADHVPGAELIQVPRIGDQNVAQKGMRVLANRYAVTSWYQFSSAQLELRAWKRLRNGFTGVVHMLWGDSDLGYMDLLCRRSGNPLCCTFHGCVEDLPAVFRHPGRLRGLAAAIVMSRTQIPYFLEQGLPKERVVFIPHGIDRQFFHRAGEPAGDVLTVLSVGSYRRNFDLLRTVCQRLAGDAQFRFEIVTSPRLREMFQDLPNVRVHSGLADEELVAAYGRAGCLLMTAEASTANNAILEALACGLPIVTERVGGIPEYVNEDCALQTTPRNAEELVAALRWLAQDPDKRRRMAAASQRQAQCFSWENVARMTGEVYRELARDGRQ